MTENGQSNNFTLTTKNFTLMIKLIIQVVEFVFTLVVNLIDSII